MTVWYAQAGNGNINAIAWNAAANGSGAALTWANLAVGDVLAANGKANIALNVDFTCARISTAAEGGTAGGNFVLSSGSVTVTANVQAGTSNCIEFSSAAGTLTIIGNVLGGTGAGTSAIHINSHGTLNITGNVVGGPSMNAYGIDSWITDGCVINITGNVTGGTASGAYCGHAMNISTAMTITINGNVTGGSNGYGGNGIYLSYGVNTVGSLTVNGNVTGGTNDVTYGIRLAGKGAHVINGDVTGGNCDFGTAAGIISALNSGAGGKCTITGKVTNTKNTALAGNGFLLVPSGFGYLDSTGTPATFGGSSKSAGGMYGKGPSMYGGN